MVEFPVRNKGDFCVSPTDFMSLRVWLFDKISKRSAKEFR